MKAEVSDLFRKFDPSRVLAAWATWVISDNQRAWPQLPRINLSVPSDIGIKIKKGAIAPDRKGATPLFSSGKLFHSLAFRPSRPMWNNLEIGTNVEYAAAQFFGETQAITNAQRRYWIVKYGLLVRAKKITPQPREFLKVTDRHMEKLTKMLVLEMARQKDK